MGLHSTVGLLPAVRVPALQQLLVLALVLVLGSGGRPAGAPGAGVRRGSGPAQAVPSAAGSWPRGSQREGDQVEAGQEAHHGVRARTHTPALSLCLPPVTESHCPQ